LQRRDTGGRTVCSKVAPHRFYTTHGADRRLDRRGLGLEDLAGQPDRAVHHVDANRARMRGDVAEGRAHPRVKLPVVRRVICELIADARPETRYSIANGILLLASILVLGGDFWDKIRALFIREAKVQFPSIRGET
jgi:hypothetical protein